MSQSIIDLSCPGCGYPVDTSMKECPACSRPVIISSFNSVFDMPMPEVNKYANTYKKALSKDPDNTELNSSIAMCYLKLKLYDKANDAFSKAIEENFDNSETFFYAAVSLLQGKKAFVLQRSAIDQALDLLNAATMIEPKGIYYYFLAYIKQDYFQRKFLNTSPSFEELLLIARENNVSNFDIEQLFIILNVPQPESLKIGF